MASWQYSKGLHSLGNQASGNSVFAWLQPDGSWGWNNAGLIVSGDKSLLVDTLWDLRLTREMLTAMADAAPAAKNIDQVVNTHANGDHCWGNQLVTGAEIIASRRGAEEMQEFTPETMVKLMKVSKLAMGLGDFGKTLGKGLKWLGLAKPADLLEGAAFVSEIFGPFHFEEVTLTPPTRTFEGELGLMVGEKRVELIEVGPAHTEGDTLVYVPEDKVLFAGDILFIEGHPIMWAGPVSNWIRACERIMGLEVEVIVPGHGPITDKAGVRGVRDYLMHLEREAKLRYDAGMGVEDAAREISRGLMGTQFGKWKDGERVAVNVDSLYREFSGKRERSDVVALFSHMARLRAGQ